MFLVSSVIFWWPVISPIEKLRLAPLWAVVYVFAACTAHTILAILITFAPLGIYPAYLQPVGRVQHTALAAKSVGTDAGCRSAVGRVADVGTRLRGVSSFHSGYSRAVVSRSGGGWGACATFEPSTSRRRRE